MITTDHLQLDKSWADFLLPEFDKDYMKSLKDFLHEEKDKGKVIFPVSSLWFNALNSTPLDKIRVVILGQDPLSDAGACPRLVFFCFARGKPDSKITD